MQSLKQFLKRNAIYVFFGALVGGTLGWLEPFDNHLIYFVCPVGLVIAFMILLELHRQTIHENYAEITKEMKSVLEDMKGFEDMRQEILIIELLRIREKSNAKENTS